VISPEQPEGQQNVLYLQHENQDLKRESRPVKLALPDAIPVWAEQQSYPKPPSSVVDA